MSLLTALVNSKRTLGLGASFFNATKGVLPAGLRSKVATHLQWRVALENQQGYEAVDNVKANPQWQWPALTGDAVDGYLRHLPIDQSKSSWPEKDKLERAPWPQWLPTDDELVATHEKAFREIVAAWSSKNWSALEARNAAGVPAVQPSIVRKFKEHDASGVALQSVEPIVFFSDIKNSKLITRMLFRCKEKTAAGETRARDYMWCFTNDLDDHGIAPQPKGWTLSSVYL